MELPKNEHFEHVGRGVERARVYGDAFVFQLPKIECLDKDGTRVYAAPDLKEFAQSFKEKGEAYMKAGDLATWFDPDVAALGRGEWK